jgi:putative membrane protein
MFTILAATSLAACTGGGETATDTETMPAGEEAAVTDAPPESPANDMPTDAAGYVQMAGASDAYEIQSSQLAVEKGQGDEVKMFAQHMIEDHQMTTQNLTTAAEAAGITPPPPQLNPMQQDMISQLEAATGEEFDRTYLQQQRQAHEMALALHQNFASNGDNPQLQEVANQAVPIVQGHIDELEGMNPS